MYEVGVFKAGEDKVNVVGGFTHVFVERETMKPSRGGMDGTIRQGLERLHITDTSKL